MNTARFKSLYHADSVVTSVGAVAAASAVSRLIGFVRGVALAWLIPQAQFGLFGVALLVVNVLLPLCSAGLYEGVARYVPHHESAGTLRRFVLRSSALVIAIALVATGVLCVFAGPVGSVLFSAGRLASGADTTSADTQPGIALMRVVVVCVFCLAVYHLFLGFLRGLRMFRAFAAAELVSALVFTLLALIGVLGGFTTATALITVYAVACVAAVVIFAPGLIRRTAVLKRPDGHASRQPASSLLTFSVWAAGTAVLWHALAYYPMWYLLKVSDGSTVGTFHAVRIVTQLVQVGAVVLTAVVAANVNRLWEHEGRDVAVPRLNLLSKACLILLIAGATVLSLARPVVMHLFPSTFAAGEAAYDALVLFFLLVGVVGLIAVRLNMVEKPRCVCLAWCVGAVVNVAASYVLLGSAGEPVATSVRALQGAAWAGVIGISSALLVCFWFVRREGLGIGPRAPILIIAGMSVGLGWPLALPILVLLVVATFATDLIFSSEERATLRFQVFTARDR